MRVVAAVLACLVLAGCQVPQPMAPKQAPAAQPGLVPVFTRVYEIGLFTPDLAWRVNVQSTGSVSAQYGSSSTDRLLLATAAADMETLYMAVVFHARSKGDAEHNIPVFMTTLDAVTGNVLYMRPEDLPEILLQLDSQRWTDRQGKPLSERMEQILTRHPLSLGEPAFENDAERD